MLKLYYSRGSSALAAHILLEEIGAPYEAEEISIPDRQHKTVEFLKVNPKGRLPVLQTPEGILTENPAILEYIAAAYPQSRLVPEGIFHQAKARSLCAYLCATVHVAYAHKKRGTRWAATAHAIEDMEQLVPENLKECADHLEAGFKHGPWAMGSQYTFCDPYLFLVGKWMAANTIDLAAYPKLDAQSCAMRKRQATQVALKAHGFP